MFFFTIDELTVYASKKVGFVFPIFFLAQLNEYILRTKLNAKMSFVHTLYVVNTELNIVYLVGINIKLIPILYIDLRSI